MPRKFYIAAIWLHCAVLLGYPFALIASGFMFDAQAALRNPFTVGLFLATLLYPAPVVAAAALCWLRRSRQEPAFFRNLLLLSLVCPVAMTLFILLLQVFCGGRFDGCQI